MPDHTSTTIPNILECLHGMFYGVSHFALYLFQQHAITMSKEEIENSDGRRGAELQKNQASKKGSYVYAAYDANDILLYVGETGTSIKSRFISDGDGAHKVANEAWYECMSTVKRLELPTNDEKYRKLVESSLIFAGNPRHQ